MNHNFDHFANFVKEINYEFSNVVMKETGEKPELPDNLKEIIDQKEKYIELPKDLEKVKKYILDNI